MYHLLFGRFALEFTENELHHFGLFLMNIDENYLKNQYCSCPVQHKIPIATLQRNLYLMLDTKDLEELKRLVFFKEENDPVKLLALQQIGYNLILN